MTHFKLLALAVMAATVLVTSYGAGAASAATTGCKTGSNPCPAGDSTSTGTQVNLKVKQTREIEITASVGDTTCSKSSIVGKYETATTPSGKLSTLTFSECNNTVSVKKNGSASVHYSSGSNGTAKISGFEVEIQAGVTCIYGGEITSGISVVGGSPLTVVITATATRTGGSFFCGSTATVHGEYEPTSGSSGYVSSGV